MEDVVVMGCGLHPFGRWPDRSVEEMGRVAIRQALDDANVEFKDIQVAYTGRVYSGMGAGLNVVNELGQTGIPVINMEMACASSSTALIQAHHVVGAGVYDIALPAGLAREMMSVPGHWVGTTPTFIGYGAEAPGGQRPREPLEDTLFEGRFGNPFASSPATLERLADEGMVQEQAPTSWRRGELRRLARMFGLPE